MRYRNIVVMLFSISTFTSLGHAGYEIAKVEFKDSTDGAVIQVVTYNLTFRASDPTNVPGRIATEYGVVENTSGATRENAQSTKIPIKTHGSLYYTLIPRNALGFENNTCSLGDWYNRNTFIPDHPYSEIGDLATNTSDVYPVENMTYYLNLAAEELGIRIKESSFRRLTNAMFGSNALYVRDNQGEAVIQFNENSTTEHSSLPITDISEVTLTNESFETPIDHDQQHKLQARILTLLQQSGTSVFTPDLLSNTDVLPISAIITMEENPPNHNLTLKLGTTKKPEAGNDYQLRLIHAKRDYMAWTEKEMDDKRIGLPIHTNKFPNSLKSIFYTFNALFIRPQA